MRYIVYYNKPTSNLQLPGGRNVRPLPPVKIWAVGLTVLFVLTCGGTFLARNTGTPWQVTVSRREQTAAVREQVQEERPVSLLPGERINLNTAPARDLARLPQIGEGRAADIVAWREEHGPFRAVEEIMEVSGIGEGIFARIEGYITVSDME